MVAAPLIKPTIDLTISDKGSCVLRLGIAGSARRPVKRASVQAARITNYEKLLRTRRVSAESSAELLFQSASVVSDKMSIESETSESFLAT